MFASAVFLALTWPAKQSVAAQNPQANQQFVTERLRLELTGAGCAADTFAVPFPSSPALVCYWKQMINKHAPGASMRSSTCRETPFQRCARQLLSLAAAGFLVLNPAFATPEKAARFYEDAQRRFDQNDMPGAVVQLKNALQEDRQMLAVHLLLGKALFRNGDLNGAEAALEEALRQGVSRSEVVLPLGQIYLVLGRPEAVIERIPAAGLPRALQVEVLSMRATAYVELGNARLARQTFSEAKALDAQALSPLIAEIPLLLSTGQLAQARENATRAIALAPNDANAWNMYAAVDHLALDVNGALTAYGRALSIEPKHADARVARAGLLIDLNREEDARVDLAFLARSAPGEPRAAYLRALLAARHGDLAATDAALHEVVKLVDALPAPWLARRDQLLMAGALSHHALGNREKAREYLTISIANNSANLAAKKLLARIYLETKAYGKALSLLEALYKAAPEDPQVMFMLGSVHMAERRYQMASDLLEKAVARTDSPVMTRTLAFSQLGLGRGELGVASLEKAYSADPSDLQAGSALAMIHMRAGRERQAVQIAEGLVKRHPDNLAALNFLGSVKTAAGDKAGARAAYTQAVNRKPGFRPTVLNLVKLDVAEKRFDEGRRRLDTMLATQRNDKDALFEYGLLEQRAGRSAQAIRHLKKATEVQHRDSRPGLALVELYLGQGQNDAALALAKELSSQYADTLLVQLMLGRAFLTNGDAARARSVFSGATRLADYDPAMLVDIARWQLAADNPDGALYSVNKALQEQPDHPAAMVLVVEIEARRGEPVRADAALKALKAQHPKRSETMLATANLAMARSQYPAAVAAYRAALAANESTAVALQLAGAYLALGDAGKAAQFLEGWVKARPHDLVAQKALAEAQFRAGHLPAARQTYASVSAAAPGDAEVLNNYANLLLQLKDPGAQGQAEKALKVAPDNPAYLDTLGWILVQTGQADAGLRYLRDARLRRPADGEIRFHLAYALARTGSPSEAREELAAALAAPESLQRLAGERSLSQLRKELGL